MLWCKADTWNSSSVSSSESYRVQNYRTFVYSPIEKKNGYSFLLSSSHLKICLPNVILFISKLLLPRLVYGILLPFDGMNESRRSIYLLSNVTSRMAVCVFGVQILSERNLPWAVYYSHSILCSQTHGKLTQILYPHCVLYSYTFVRCVSHWFVKILSRVTWNCCS